MLRYLGRFALCALPLTGAVPPASYAAASAGDAPAAVPVFVSGREGYRSFRIPAIVRLPDHDLLAFADGRVDGPADFGDVKVVMKRSRDGGRTWSGLQVVASNGSLQADNAAPVVDRLDPAYPHGRLCLFYDTGDQPEQAIRRGIGQREVWYAASTDGGHRWSAPVNITAQVKKSGWRAYANTPGHAIQLRHGRYGGRIYVAANHSAGAPQSDSGDYRAHGFYSDDHGRTFHLSEDVPIPGGNEATATELSGNGLMLNIRNQAPRPRQRIVAISRDGGVHWDAAHYDPALPDPASEGSMLAVGRARDGKTILAFCNDADASQRRNLGVRISFDGGRTWPDRYPVDAQARGTGYSDLVQLGPHALGVLYERDDYAQIAFKVIRWKPQRR
ncbi:MAG TPA: sialidase family protein [Rhodanobacteraceae bacterium]|nr:sialidase family protein [Rhodanobacteraceae bacterium]